MFLSTSDTMKFVIPGANVKTTGKVIHCLAKIGDEVYLEPSLDSLTLRAVNLSRSAFAQFSFGSSFFSSIEQDAEVSVDNPGSENCKVKVFLETFNLYWYVHI